MIEPTAILAIMIAYIYAKLVVSVAAAAAGGAAMRGAALVKSAPADLSIVLPETGGGAYLRSGKTRRLLRRGISRQGLWAKRRLEQRPRWHNIRKRAGPEFSRQHRLLRLAGDGAESEACQLVALRQRFSPILGPA